jgi:MFS family permease
VTTQDTAVAGPRRSLWRNGDFVRFWSGETLSLFGTQITMLALPLTAVITLNAQPGELGILRFLQMVPYLLVGPLFGVWVDRHRRLTAMIGANTVRMILIGLVPLLAAFDALTVPLLLAITFGVGMAGVLFDVSWMSFVPTLVRDPDYLVEANAKLATTAATAEAAGPGVAGSLVNLLSAPIAIAANAFTFLGSVLSLLMIRVREEVPVRSSRQRPLAELKEGLRFVAGNTYVRWVAAVGAMANFFMSATQPMFLLYAVRDREVPPSVLGLMLTIGACGGILGGLLSQRLLSRLRLGHVYAGGLIMAFASSLLLPIAAGPTWVVYAMFTAAWFLSFVGLSIVNVLIMSLRQRVTPSQMLGRMNAAVRAVMFGVGALGGPVAGGVAAVVGVRGALWVSTTASALFVVSVVFSPVTRLETMPPAAASD